MKPALPREPAHENLAAARRWRKQSLAIAFRALARAGADYGFAGHMSLRDPEFPDQFWVNPMCLHFGRIRAADLLLLDGQGNLLRGEAPYNKAAFAIHSAIHHARPDVVTAVHAHSVHGRAFSTLGRKLLPLTQDACAFHESHGIFDAYSGVVLDTAEGARIGAALGDGKAVILANHGLLTVGGSPEEAAWWFLSMEDCCRVQLLAEAAGTPRPLDETTARHTAAQTGAARIGWLMFWPLRARIVAEEPEVLEDTD